MSSPEIPVYRFENVEVDTLRCRLKERDEELHLRQQAFDVLVYLLENRERVISKDELITNVWSNTAVVDDALVQCIKDIRRALNDDPHRPRFIRTVPKLGYRFISPVTEVQNASMTSTQIEEVTRVELEIEESNGIASAVNTKLKNLIASRRARFVFPAAVAVAIFVSAGLFYFAPRLFASISSSDKSAQVITNNSEALRYYLLGVEKAQAAHSKEAIEYFETAIELDPDFAMAHARIGYVYALMWDQPEKARPYLDRAAALSNRLSEKDKLHLAAWTAVAERDYPAAIPPLRELIEKFPQETEAYWRLGRLMTGEGRHDEAVAVLKQGLAVDPEAKNIFNFLGGLTSSLGRHDEAIALEQRYVELAPGEPNAYDSLGMALQHAGRYAEAATQYQKALDLQPDFEIALAHFANTRFQQGRYRDAIALYERYLAAAKSDAEKARGHSRIAIIYCRLKDFAEADKAAWSAAQYNKDDFSSLLVAVERSDLSAAHALENQLLARSQFASRGVRNDSRIKFYLRGMLALKKGQNDEAIENFRQTLNYLPPMWDLMDFEDALANGFLAVGQFDQSIDEFNRILAVNPNYPLVYFRIAEAYDRVGRVEQALKNYKKFLEVWKDADTNIPEVAAAKKRIT